MTRALILMFVLSVSTSAVAQSDPPEQGGTVWFFYPDEEPSPLGKPMLLHVNILTRQLATIGPGEYFGYPVPVGIHAFSYTRAPSRDEYLGLSVKPGQDVYVEVHFRDLKVVSPEEGRLAIQQSRPISVLNVIDRSVIVVGAAQPVQPPAPPAVAVVREIPAPKPPPPSMLLLPPAGKSAPSTLLLAPHGEPASPASTLSPQPGQKEPQKESASAAPPQTSSVPLIKAPPPQKTDVSTPLNVPPQRATFPQVAAATPPTPILNAIESFPKARLHFLMDGTRREVDAVVALDHNAFVVTDRKDRSVLKMFSYPNIRGAEYAFARSPKWKTPVLGNVFFLDPKTKKHWFMVRTDDDYALIELDSANSNLVLEAFEIRAGRKVETVEDSR